MKKFNLPDRLHQNEKIQVGILSKFFKILKNEPPYGMKNLPAMCKTLQVPSFLMEVPDEHFAGVSEPCPTLAEARKNAIYDVVRQVLGSIGSQYDHRFVFNTSGNPEISQTSMRDNLFRAASGIVLGIEQNIVKSEWHFDQSNRYVYFILVHYSDTLIEKVKATVERSYFAV